MPRITRGGVLVGAVLMIFVAFVVFGGHLLGDDDSHSGAPPSVPSSSDDGTNAAEPAPPVGAQQGQRPIGASGGALPQADGVQAVSGDAPKGPPPPAQRDDSLSWPELVVYGLLVGVSMVLFTVAATTLWWMLHAWRSPEALASTGFRRRSARGPRTFSLLLPARHEQDVLGDTINTLAQLDHPAYEVLVIIGHDDPETERVARAAAARHRKRVRVVMDHNVPKNKPKALNTALRECRGEIVGVFDAEDDVHRGLLRLV
jgi:glycosyltransferase XagB